MRQPGPRRPLAAGRVWDGVLLGLLGGLGIRVFRGENRFILRDVDVVGEWRASQSVSNVRTHFY